MIHGSEPLEGGQILPEWDGAVGVILWQGFRDIVLWANSSPAERREAFSASARGALAIEAALSSIEDEKVRTALQTLADVVRHPADLRDDQVARSCKRISEWAGDQGNLQTALAYAQAAALAARLDPAAAFAVATLAVRVNDHARAEVWFRRAVGLARRSRDWRMYSRSFSGLGNLYMRRGNLPAAHRLHQRALRGARRGGMRREQAAALHDLFAVAIETHQPLEAEKIARQALETYGLRSGRVHVLAHDVAYFWMEHGHFERALSVFQAVLPLIRKPMERLWVLADIARAAGGTGQSDVALEAASEVNTLVGDPDLQRGVGRALLEVARGFMSLRDAERAEAAARRAVLFAERFRESKVRFAAEAILDSLKKPDELVEESFPEGSPAEKDSGDRLAADFVRTLETIAGAAQE